MRCEKILVGMFLALSVTAASSVSAGGKGGTLYNETCNGCDPNNGDDPQVQQILQSYAGAVRNGDIVQIQDSVMESNPPSAFFYVNWRYHNGTFIFDSKGYNYLAGLIGPDGGNHGPGGSAGGAGSGAHGWVCWRAWVTAPSGVVA